ncbi:hypothetical protein LKR43_02615 [Pusillimonas sp. MFBS29]|uniref:hypothetical protein n=1 Tax=Pusillimonas sp. MFBS29 TaxID=2886690 RepID=UPI001D1022C8|nr:hypothetical protein [Pusillimonas sp. MFBS29]MCC2595224.1 hypothetical protein [Pusillimonas sp. MFBS29]
MNKNMEGEAVVVDTTSNEIVNRFDLGAEQPLNLAYDKVHNRLLLVDQGHPKMLEFQKKDMPGYESRRPGSRVVAIDLATGKTVALKASTGTVFVTVKNAKGAPEGSKESVARIAFQSVWVD